MLRYLASGHRRFGLYPIPIHARGNWEFFAVVRGKCGAMLTETAKPQLRQRHLWVFAPEISHGWTGSGAQKCEVAVFHFVKVPPLLEKIVRPNGFFDKPLTAAQARRITELEKNLREHHQHVTELSHLVFEHALAELSLLTLEDISFERVETKSEMAARKVEAALSWYSEHMAEQPKLEQVAQAANVSVRHLRRLFEQARHETPQKTFTKLRLERAMELLSGTNLKLDAVATKCGFSSASDFCRVFKECHRTSPDAWRKTQLPPYKEPR
jgi:AraC family transcriptional regulator